MKRSKTNRNLFRNMSTGRFLLILVLLFAVSAGTSFFLFKDKFAFDSSFIADIESRQDKKVSESPKKETSRLYRAEKQEQDSKDNAVSRKDTLLVAAEDIIKKYVTPYNVRLLDLYMDQEGVIYIDFGDELKRNFNGDAIEEIKVLAGLFSGLRSTVPGFTALKILIEGKEAESFGGHVDISKPIGEEIAKHI